MLEIPIAATNFPTATGSAAVPDPTIVEAYEQDATVLAPDFQVLGKAYPVAVLCKNAYPEPNIKASKFKPQIPAACKVAGDSYASKIKALPATADIPKPTATNLEMMSDIITGTVDNVPYKFWMGASMAYTGSDVAEWATSHCTNALNLMTTNIKDVKDDFPSRCVWTDSPPESPLSMTEDAPPPESTGGHQRREATPDGVLLGGDVYAITDLDTEHLILHVGFEAGGDNAKTSAIKLREGPYDIYMDHVMNPGLTYTTIDATGKILDHKPGADPKLPDVADNEVPLGRTAEAGAGPGGNVYGDEDNPKDPPPAPPNPGENPTGDDDDDVCDGDYDDEEGGTAPPPQATGSSKYFLY